MRPHSSRSAKTGTERVNDGDELCQRLLSVWHSTGQNVIDEVIDQWRARLTACVRAKGGHFEHLV